MADADEDTPVYLLLGGDIGSWNLWRSGRPRTRFRINLSAVHLTAADLSDADLSDANMRGVDLTGANLTGANLRGAYLRGAIFRDANFAGANLAGANLTRTNLTDANFTSADLHQSKLILADLTRANFTDANLTSADLHQSKLILANLTRANFTDANLTDADLHDTILRDTILRDADLTSANLIGADLTSTDLTHADLRDADLRDTILRDADLNSANLIGADLTSTDLTNAIGVGEVGDAESSPATLFVALTELRLVLPDGVDPSDVAEIVGAVAALARLVVTVGVDVTPPGPDTQGSTAVAVATQSPESIDIATIRLHYGSDFIQWLGESWHWLEVTGGVTGGGGLGGLAIKDFLKRGDSKVLALLRTVFSRTGRETLTNTLDAKNDEQLAAARAAVAKHNSETVKHLAETLENTVRFVKAVEQFPATTHEQAQANINAATHLAADTQQALIGALGSLSPLLNQGLTATTILTTQGDDNPQLN